MKLILNEEANMAQEAKGQIKKLYIVQILDILKKYSDCDHTLQQKDIIRLMRRDFGVECERKAISRNIENLKDMGFDIEYDKGYYLVERPFEESELRLLVDGILASRYIPMKQAKELIEKLTAQSNIYFKKKVKHISCIINMEHEDSNELFYNIEVLSQAIEENKQVLFYYKKYDIQKRLVNTTLHKHRVNPYQIVLANGKYYLVANIDKYDNVIHFRVERISGIEITDLVRKDSKCLDEMQNGFDLPRHMLEHIYMFGGESKRIKLRIKNEAVNDILDWLGTDIDIIPETENNTFTVTVKANEKAMKYWALQFGESVTILEPESLKMSILEAVDTIYQNYTLKKLPIKNEI